MTTLFKTFVTGMTDYIVRHVSNYTLIENALNLLESQIAALSGAIIPQIPVPYCSYLTVDLSDLAFSGEIASFTAGEGLVIGELCYLNSDGKLYKAKADSNTTSPVIAIATGTIAINEAGYFLLKGFLRNDAWSALTVGDMDGLIYASDLTGGAFTQTKTRVVGNYLQVVGFAYAANILFFNPMTADRLGYGEASLSPSMSPSLSPSKSPSLSPSISPSLSPSVSPST